MELREIRTFLTLAEELHFTRTAARLRVAQSAVSYAIKNLEQEIGAELVTRTKRSVRLTAAGESFRVRAARVLGELEQAAEESRRVARGQAGRLVLRFTLTSALTVVPRALARFQRAYPEVELDIQPGGTHEQLEALRLGRCDIGFVAFKRADAPLHSEPVQRAPLVALVSSGHPLAGRKRLRLSDLANERFVFLKLASEPQVRGFFERHCRDAGFEPNIALEIEQLEVLLAMVAAGVGISCAPGFVRLLRFPGVAALPLTPRIMAGISAVWDPSRLSAAGQRFLAILREERALAGAAERVSAAASARSAPA
jgi:LysR family transcriptional regulator, benzoate and cis,cis-muconate-responsive activator of ben and cat genes